MATISCVRLTSIFFLQMALLFDKSLETWPETALKESLEFEKKGSDLIVYFIVGSHVNNEIHVAHMARCPLPDTVDPQNSDEYGRLIDDDWITDYSEKVLRMLCGGITIVGVAAVCSKKIFSDQRSSLHKSLAKTQRMMALMSALDLEPAPSTMVLLHLDMTTKKMSTVIIDVVKRGPDTPTKVTYSQLKWVSLVTRVAIDIRTAIDVIAKDDFYAEFTSALKPWATSLFSSDTLITFDGEIREDSEDLVKDLKKAKDISSFEVLMYLNEGSGDAEPSDVQKIGEVFEVSFDLAVRASVPVKSTVAEGKRALRHHIIRQLMARASLHYESMGLQEEGARASPALHQLPRACTTVIPTGGALLVYDFLFEADTADDAIKNFNQLLGLKVSSVEEVDELWERNLSEGEVEEPSLIIQNAHRPPAESSSSIPYILIFLAVIAVIFAIIFYIVLKVS